MDAVVLNGRELTIEQLLDVAYRNREVALDAEALRRAEAARQVLFDMAAAGKPVYGLNRGVGWNKDKEFDPDFFEAYNRNLINSHSLGMPPYASSEEVRAMMCIRLNCALCGRTGISTELMRLYVEFLNRGIHPRVGSRGSIGEGDITTLSMIGLAMIGEGEVEYRGKIVPAAEALAAEGLSPAKLGPKDGLSIVSSNAQGMAAAAALVREAETLIRMADLVFCLSLEGLNGGLQPLDARSNALRGLAGQIESAARCRDYLKGSYLEQPDPKRALQDPLSFRCATAVVGTVTDALGFVRKTLETELNVTEDNPCILYESAETLVSQNFETTTLAVGVEMLANALCHLSKNICHRTLHLSDPAFTGLTRFLTPVEVKTIAYGTIQKDYVYLDAENRSLANPSSMDFIAVAGGIEDHASQLPLVVSKAAKIVDNLRYMLGIELMHAAQAVDLRGVTELGEATRRLHDAYRRAVPFYGADRNLSADIAASYAFLNSDVVETLL